MSVTSCSKAKLIAVRCPVFRLFLSPSKPVRAGRRTLPETKDVPFFTIHSKYNLTPTVIFASQSPPRLYPSECPTNSLRDDGVPGNILFKEY